jgi:hypothetical protein
MPSVPQVLTDVVVHTGTGERIDDGVVAWSQGKLVYVGPRENFSGLPDAQVRSLPGAHVYPGFILTDNILGLTETDALKPTHDFRETGDLNPEVRACVAFNTDSKIIPTVRSNGVLLVQSTPRGSLVAGTSSVMRLDGWNWEDAAIRCADGVHIYWPARVVKPKGSPNPKTGEEEDPERARRETLHRLEQFLLQSLAYAKAPESGKEVNIHFEAMKPVWAKKSPLYLHVSGAAPVLEALAFFRRLGPANLVLCGVPDTGHALKLLKEQGIPVILPRLHKLPDRDDHDYDLPFRMPVILKQHQILFALSYAGDMEAMGSRNLPFVAGTAVAFGLPYEEAVAAISLWPARILGIDKEYGSLEAGKSATLFVSRGDALDIRSNDVLEAWIDGRPLDLDNHQKQLYRQYLKKYGLN